MELREKVLELLRLGHEIYLAPDRPWPDCHWIKDKDGEEVLIGFDLFCELFDDTDIGLVMTKLAPAEGEFTTFALEKGA